MNDADHRALELLFLDNLTADDARVLAECSPVGMAALLLSPDESAADWWYEHHRPGDEPIARLLSRAVNREDVADRIDANLRGDPGVLADLVRAGVVWDHPGLPALLDNPAFRFAAAWMVAQTDRPLLQGWLSDERDPEEVVDVARAAALAGAHELFDTLADWRDALDEVGDPYDARVDATLFILSPARWGRRFLRGEWEAQLLTDSLAMADLLGASRWSYWSQSLALWEGHDVEFAFVARLVAAGAGASLTLGFDDDIEPLVAAFDSEDWSTLATHPAFAIANAFIPEKDDALTELVLESAAHDLLSTRGVSSPGIRGLPLSPTEPTGEELEWAAEWLAEIPEELETPFDVVATLTDLARLARYEGIEPVREAARPLLDHPHEVVADAAELVFEPPAVATLADRALGEDVPAFAAAEQLAGRGEEGVEHLIELWANGPPSRATLYADLVYEELRFLHSRQES
jgi:hypothetical protein